MKVIKNFLKINWWRIATFVTASIIILLNLFRLRNTMPFTSDGVYVQNFIYALQNHTHDTAIFPADSYLLKTPFYWLIIHSGLSPTAGLFVTFTAFTFFAFFGFYIAIALINKTLKWFNEKHFALAFIYFVSLGATYDYMMIPNTRNLESGLTFLLLVPLVIGFKKGLSRTYIIGAIFILSLLLFEDPYFLYAVFLPLLAIIILSSVFIKKRVRHLLVAAIILVSVVLAELWKFIVSKFGIALLSSPLKLVALSKLAVNIKTATVALFLLGGSLETLRLHPAPLASYLNYLVVGFLMIYSLILIAYNLKNLTKDPWKVFILSIPWLITLIYIVQPNISADNYRYILFAVFGFPIILAFLFSSLARKKMWLVSAELLIFVAVIFNVHHSFKAMASNQHRNADNYQIVQVAESLGLVKGYTDYWSASINTYFSGGKTSFAPVVCAEGRLQPMYWAIDTGGFTKLKSTRTFYLYDNLGFYTKGCSIDDLNNVYGAPTAIQVINSRYSLAIYDYDIGSKMNLTYP